MNATGDTNAAGGAGDKGGAATEASATTAASKTDAGAKGAPATEQSMLAAVDAGADKSGKAGDETKNAAETKDTKAETKGDEKKPPALVDEKWEPKAIEGLTRDSKVLGEARELFKKLGLNAEQAQALVDYSDAQSKAAGEAQGKSLEEARTESRKTWWKELEADKQLGGANIKQTQATCRRAVLALGGKDLGNALVEMGLDNFPPLVRAFEKAGRLMAEDTVESTVTDGGKKVGDPYEAALRKTYPSMFKES